MISAADVHAILDALDAAGVQVWLQGGWGVDALLERQTREHADLDAAIRQDDLERARAALAPLGFTCNVQQIDMPARFLLSDEGGRQIDSPPAYGVLPPGRVDARRIGRR